MSVLIQEIEVRRAKRALSEKKSLRKWKENHSENP